MPRLTARKCHGRIDFRAGDLSPPVLLPHLTESRSDLGQSCVHKLCDLFFSLIFIDTLTRGRYYCINQRDNIGIQGEFLVGAGLD